MTIDGWEFMSIPELVKHAQAAPDLGSFWFRTGYLVGKIFEEGSRVKYHSFAAALYESASTFDEQAVKAILNQFEQRLKYEDKDH